MPSRIIVPAWNERFDQREGRARFFKRAFDEIVIGENLTRECIVEELRIEIRQRNVLCELMRGKFDGPIETKSGRIMIVEALAHDDDRVFAELIGEERAPTRDRPGGVGNEARAINHQERPALDSNIAPVGEMPGIFLDKARVAILAIVLRDEHFAFHSVPTPRPVFVGPHETERHVDIGRLQKLFQRSLKQSLAVERVVIEHETVNAGRLGHLRLSAHRVARGERIETEIARNARLVMVLETRLAARDVRPFGETFAPPGVVLRERMELGEVIGEDLGAPVAARRQRSELLEMRSRPGESFDLSRDRCIVLRWDGEYAGLPAMLQIVLEGVALRIPL